MIGYFDRQFDRRQWTEIAKNGPLLIPEAIPLKSCYSPLSRFYRPGDKNEFVVLQPDPPAVFGVGVFKPVCKVFSHIIHDPQTCGNVSTDRRRFKDDQRPGVFVRNELVDGSNICGGVRTSPSLSIPKTSSNMSLRELTFLQKSPPLLETRLYGCFYCIRMVG